MATLYTEVALKESAGPNLENRHKTAAHVGRALQIKEARYTTTGAEAAADIITVCNLPIGAQVKPELCRILTEASGGTGTTIATLGDAGSASRYSATAVVLTSAANLAVVPTAAITSAYVIAAGNESILAAIGLSSGSITAGKTIIFQIAYLLP